MSRAAVRRTADKEPPMTESIIELDVHGMTLYQVELRANDHTCRGGIADLDGWGVSRLDYLGGYSRRFGVWFK